MKIEKNYSCHFEEIEIGEVFEKFGTIYLKVPTVSSFSEESLNAFCLDFSEFCSFDSEEIVEKVDATLVIHH